jgi:hypothetical protein
MTSSASPTLLDPPSGPTRDGARRSPEEIRSRRLRFAAMASTYGLLLAVVVVATLVRNDGTFTYAIDDPLIHLTIARNLARAGTFGVVPGAYESASSAPLWNLLLAPVLAVVADAWWLPLVANVLAALWLLWIVSDLPALARLGRRRRGVAAAALAAVALGLVPLTMTGMEHTLHMALVAAFLVVLARRGSEREGRRDLLWLVLLLATGTLLRFETGFVAVAAAIVLLVERPLPQRARGGRPWFTSAVLVAAAAVPALGFAAVNLAFGQYALPSSVVAKADVGRGRLPSPSVVLGRVTEDRVLLLLLAVSVAVLALAWWGPGTTTVRRRATRALTTALLAAALHLVFADVGWFERYEAYLIGGMLVGLAIVAPELRGWPSWRRWTIPALCVVCLLRVPLFVMTPLATTNTYSIQYQLGQLFEESYGGRGVALNDLGYVSWFHHGPVVDIIGLGSFEALQAKRDRDLDADRFAELADAADAEILAIYELYASLVPEGWSEAGRWCVTQPLIVLVRECVVFYAPDGDALARARSALAGYAPRLPDDTTTTLTAPT